MASPGLTVPHIVLASGANNHGLKAVAATLSPACCLLFSKSKAPNGMLAACRWYGEPALQLLHACLPCM